VEAHRLDSLSDVELLESFRTDGDPAAFEAIVRRHGERVLAACHKVLADSADVEDAFQATFLVLLRQAGGIRRRHALGSFLYGVAHRVALQARSRAARRARAEARKPACSAAEPSDLSWREACRILHEELDRLPDVYRLPLILCYLEGRSRDDAAQQLGCKTDVLRGRLERGRGRLRDRLTRRGVTLSAGLLAAVANTGTAALPPSHLIQSTLTAAAGRPSPAVTALAQGASHTMIVGKVRLLTAAVLLFGLLAVGSARPAAEGTTPVPGRVPAAANDDRPSAGAYQPKPEQAPPPPAKGQPPAVADKAEPDVPDTFTYSGRVLDPDGKSLAGARVYICGLTAGVIDFKERTKTGADGRFRFTVKKEEFQLRGDERPGSRVIIGATAPGCGAAVGWDRKSEQREDMTLWLPAEQIVKGRILDLQGQPVAGVKVGAYIRGAQWAKDGRPIPFDAKEGAASANVLPDDPDLAPAVSDKDGRFTLRGLGKDWLYELSFGGPTIERRKAQLVTRPQEPKQVPGAGVYTPERGAPKVMQYGCEFTHVAAPSKPIIGVVRDKETGKPVAGARVGKQWTRDDDPWGWTTTDKDGRYRLEGLSWAVHELTVDPPANTPYLRTTARAAADRPGTEPVTCDVEILRQRLVSGRVTDRVSGKPVSGWVEYRPLADNPTLKTVPFLAEPTWPPRDVTAQIDKDGRFSIPTLSGRGVLVVRAVGSFLPAPVAESDRKAGAKVVDAKDPELLDTRPRPLWPAAFHAYRVLDVPAREDPTCDLTVDAGRSLALTALAPDGKAREVWALGLEPLPFDRGGDLPGGRGTIRALAERERRRVFLQTTDGKYAGVVVLRGDETEPLTAKLQPTGTITGRVVDTDGKPLTGLSFQVAYDDGPGRTGVYFGGGGFRYRFPTPAESNRQQRIDGFFGDKRDYLVGPEKSDDQGRFRLDGLFPEVAFDLKVMLTRTEVEGKQKRDIIVGMVKVARPTVKPGEVLDVGDVKVEKATEKPDKEP
jgi:RNA polymerase sigma factor (sigma-70 family)